MRKTVRRRHNKDGSVTTTTSYSRKGLLGTRHVDTYVSKTPAPGRIKYSTPVPKANDPIKRQEQLQKELQKKYERILCKPAFYCFAISFGIAFVIPSFMLFNVLADLYDFSTFIIHWLDYLKAAAVIIFPCTVIGVTNQVIYVRRRHIWLDKIENNAEHEKATSQRDEKTITEDENQTATEIQENVKTNDTINPTNNIDETINNAKKEGEAITQEVILNYERRKTAADKLKETMNPIKDITEKSVQVVTTQKKFDDSTIEQLKKRYIAFDVETTGLNSFTERIIEVGAVVFENMIPVKEYGSLVNTQKPISAQTTAINHITNEMIRNAPSEEQVYTELVNFLGDSLNAKTIICAHNADFDMGFLSKALKRLGFKAEINYVDTLSAAQRLAPESPDHKLSTLANHFRILVEQDHEAVSDAKVCGEILARLIVLEQEEKEKRLIQEEEKRQQEELMQKMLIEYSDKRSQVSINPVHNRVPLDSIERLKKSDIERDNGQKFWENGDILRKGGNIETAIEFFDKARYSGYCSPELYQSYAKAYRQLKDYDNEIDILDEAIYRFKNDRDVWEKFQTRRYKAVCLLIKKNEKTDKNKSDKTEEEKNLINV